MRPVGFACSSGVITPLLTGLQCADMTGMSVELVEGALGESADFLIATYGMDAVHKDGLKPTAFNTSGEAELARSGSALGLQEKTQLGAHNVCLFLHTTFCLQE